MAKNRLARLDRLMRALHLYTSMFLVPWMMIYAISAFLIHHKEWFGDEIQPKWEVSREIDFDPGPTIPLESEDQALMILEHLDLDGAHSVVGDGALNVLETGQGRRLNHALSLTYLTEASSAA